MYGIIGYIGPRDVVPVLIDGLRKLEYRGYDSAGVAVVSHGPANVANAVGTVGPYAVDVSSGVEAAPGIKDAAKLRAFFAALEDVRAQQQDQVTEPAHGIFNRQL